MGMMTRRNVKARITPETTRAVKAAPVVEKEPEIKEETNVESVVTRDVVDKMPYFALKKLAQNHDIDVEGKKAAKLKEEIIKKLNL